MKKLNVVLILSLIMATSNLFSQEIEVWISDAGGLNNPPWLVYKADGNGNNLTEVMNQSDNIEWTEDIFFLEDEQAVHISNLSSNGNISKHDINTGDFIEIFAEVAGRPTRMKLGPDGFLYVLQWSNSGNKVLRFELDGTFVDEFTDIGVSQSISLDWDASGNLYVSSYGGSSVQKFDTNGNHLGAFIDSGLSGPINIFFDKSGNGDLIVFNWNSGIVKRFDSNGIFIEDLITGVPRCEGVDFMPNGDILIGVGFYGSVKRYDSDFNYIEDFIESGTLITPNAIIIRDLTLSNPDFDKDLNFIIPTFGTQFSIIPKLSVIISPLMIYDSSGKLLEKLNLNETAFWNAEKYASGLYIIKAITTNGKSITQKVIVKK